MRRDYSEELSPEVREKMKKNLVYITMFSIVMLFAGFSSAYIVSMGDSFWLKVPFPTAFWVSTGIIVASSLTYILAINAAKKNEQGQVKMFMLLTFLLGVGFVYFQFKGYGQLSDSGVHAINNHIVVTDGRYGDYFELKIGDDFLEVDGNHYMINGKDLTEAQMKDLQKFMSQFLTFKENEQFKVDPMGGKYTLFLNQAPLAIADGQLVKTNGEELKNTDNMRLTYLAMNVRDGRGDFFVKGEIGKDFNIYYKGEALTYKNRELMWKGRKLDKYLQLKAVETADTASSFLYIMTILHLLHIFGTLFYQLKMTIGSFSGKFNSNNHLSLRLGAIFWHFLGLLWFYLLLFLLFIH